MSGAARSGRRRRGGTCASIVALALAAGFPAGCGGGGGHSGAGPTLQIYFDPSSPPPFANGSLALFQSATAQSTSGGSVFVGVAVTGVNGVFTVDFDLVFDPTSMTFVRATEGTFLSAAGTVPTQLVATTVLEFPSVERIVVGITRTGPAATDVDATGQQTLLTLEFRANGPAGSVSALDFDASLRPPEILSQDGTVVGPSLTAGGTLHIDPL